MERGFFKVSSIEKIRDSNCIVSASASEPLEKRFNGWIKMKSFPFDEAFVQPEVIFDTAIGSRDAHRWNSLRTNPRWEHHRSKIDIYNTKLIAGYFCDESFFLVEVTFDTFDEFADWR